MESGKESLDVSSNHIIEELISRRHGRFSRELLLEFFHEAHSYFEAETQKWQKSGEGFVIKTDVTQRVQTLLSLWDNWELVPEQYRQFALGEIISLATTSSEQSLQIAA